MDPFDGQINHIHGRVSTHQKPFYCSEYGSITTNAKCSRPVSSVRCLMLTGFTGSFGIGMDWDSWKVQDHSHWQYFEGVTEFFSGLGLNDCSWAPFSSQLSPFEHVGETGGNVDIPPKSILGLIDVSAWESNQLRMVGVIANNTYNNFSMRSQTCECQNPNAVTQAPIPPIGLNSLQWAGGGPTFHWDNIYYGEPTNLDSDDPYVFDFITPGLFPGVTHYAVKFWDPFTAEYLDSEPQVFSSNIFGQFELPHPNLIADQRPFVFFELWDAENHTGVRLSDAQESPEILALDSASSEENQNLPQIVDLTCSPNPCHGLTSILWSGDTSISLSVIDATGKVVDTVLIQPNEPTQLQFEPGTYVLSGYWDYGHVGKVVVSL